MSIETRLPERVKEVERVSRREGVPPEEIISRAVVESLRIADPQTKAELHENLCKKFLNDAEELLRRGDYIQASEKAWGAASQMVKAIAAKDGLELRSHGELHRFVSKVSRERDDERQSAGMLHQNFHENWLPRGMVEGNVEDVKELVKRLRGKENGVC